MSSTEAPDTAAPNVLDSWFVQLAAPDVRRSATGNGVQGIVGKQLSRIRTIRKIADDLGYVETGRILLIEARKALGR
ncbi:hypothetical protein QMG83_14935 [Salinibacterium sp. G-O1]|uniref:hypothetical protein n=1 Tax=Salinibacterium sp. G-O1 TaxID=3046208 RepID=UPI0024BAD22E|nr:hypothetical protein [Salinibacterium sp. G-O1]MDJ0336521.1 hypothetical protein [Salinibacterium sp. G-O1]